MVDTRIVQGAQLFADIVHRKLHGTHKSSDPLSLCLYCCMMALPVDLVDFLLLRDFNRNDTEGTGRPAGSGGTQPRKQQARR